MSRIGFDDQFWRQTTSRVVKLGVAFARPVVAEYSTTLARSLVGIVDDPKSGRLHIPQYWAPYVNDGRRAPLTPLRSTFFIWFRDPKQDPRHRGRYPVRLTDVRRLSKGELRFWSRRNRQLLKEGFPISALPMVITKIINNPTEPKRFFDNEVGMAGFSELAFRQITSDVNKRLKKSLQNSNLRLNIRVDL